MSQSSAQLVLVRRGRWVDVVLACAGVSLVVAGQPAAGVALVAAGLFMPAWSWVLARRAGGQRVAHLVPDELTDAHARLVAAAGLPGVLDGAEAVAAADDMVFEVAATLAGDPPRGATQRRFVEARVRALNETAGDLRDRHAAWVSACAEVDELSALELPVPAEPVEDGRLVRVLLVALAPVFVAWEIVGALGRGAVTFCVGIVLRLRTLGRLVVHACRACVGLVVDLARRWSEIRARVADAARQARRRFVTARVRLQLAVRRRRRVR